MCGIAGIWFIDKHSENPTFIKRMTDKLIHRGPDAEGQWTNEKGLYLGHRRLSILDLDPRSNQPFHYLERYTITFNGEIYNYLEIKEKLISKGYLFNTNSDTEVICAAYNEWREKCLQEFDGMFAFVLYDKLNETIFCARDRFGEKPFYYAFHEGNFFFASEMKALWKVGIKKVMREEMIFNYLIHDLVEDVNDSSKTFFEGIYKLKASHYFYSNPSNSTINQIQYYKPINSNSFKGSFEEIIFHSTIKFPTYNIALASNIEMKLTNFSEYSFFDAQALLDELRNKEQLIYSSKTYRLGHFLTSPLRLFR